MVKIQNARERGTLLEKATAFCERSYAVVERQREREGGDGIGRRSERLNLRTLRE